MSQHKTETPKPGIALDDIYYVVFKHWGKIAILAAAGLLAALCAKVFWPVVYKSEAELFIKYVQEARSTPGIDEDASIKSPDHRGESIINNELAILTSLDVAKAVATAIPSETAAKLAGEVSTLAVAATIRSGLTAEVPKRSSVIHIVFAHPNPEVVQPVLNLIVEQYKLKHVEIHRPVGLFDDFLTQETDQLRSRLVSTEKQLRELKNNAGIISMEEAMKAYAEQISAVRRQIFEAETELAMLNHLSLSNAAPSGNTNAELATVGVNSAEALSGAPTEKLAEYLKVRGLLASFQRQEQDFLLRSYTPEHPSVKSVRDQIQQYETQKASLEQMYPGLAALPSSERNVPGQSGEHLLDPVAEAARVPNLQSKVRILKEHLSRIYSEASALNEKAPTIADLERQIEMQQARYRAIAANQEQARMEGALGPDRISNIGTVQSPTPARREVGHLPKVLLGLVGGGLAVGLALAFLLELYLDKSLKRPMEVEAKLGLPLILSIPDVGRNGKTRLMGNSKAQKRLADSGTSTSPPEVNGKSSQPASTEIVPWSLNHGLRSYLEALRDRLVFYFEIRNLTHKPKLVAITTCGEGAGASTVAAGLAATLSETGDGKVLLVDMNLEKTIPYHFQRGDLRCGLDEVLDGEKRDEARVQEHLYLVSHASGEDKLTRILPKRFTHLVPKLKASDYDFIIFDMPPVNQLSVTPQLARFMDMVLMVVESEKTSRDVVKRACGMLTDSKGNVGIVLNKTRSYVPRRLQQEM